MGILLATRLLRGAGLDWYEQGDVWHRVAAHRSTSDTPTLPGLSRAVGALITAADDAPGSPLHTRPAWRSAFAHTGRRLARLAHSGDLQRGLRAVLAHHLLFLFNRIGIPGTEQHHLAAAAHSVFREDHHMSSAPVTGSEDHDADRLRAALADHIRARGTFRTAAVEQAFRSVPRHLFLPEVDAATAYAPRPVVTKRDADGAAVSSASSPNLVAAMLELLDVRPGQRVLEIGAATGINAALLAEVVGETGAVSTVEIDADLTERAQRALVSAGYGRVVVHCGDGALGHPESAPFDRIIVTAGAWDVPPAWWQQLVPGGRLVVPVRLHGSGLTRVLPFDRDRDAATMTAREALVCGFVPMRGIDDHPDDVVRLARDVLLAVDRADGPDAQALANVLTYEPSSAWTGVVVGHDDEAEHLDLWLATTTSDLGFGRLRVGPDARGAGAADPALRWAGASLYLNGSLAYVVVRPHDERSDELGIVAHGPESAGLIERLRSALDEWARRRPTQPMVTAHSNPVCDVAGIRRQHSRLVVRW
ncbi:Protein-L-isoaspartate O-methyltransferase [Pseudonocardia sp. Ae263_Ps1]|uniref:methyltransferase, FxLD system n=1 Tax=Pseudonocardia sp. Ae150A_Ps1 TaxID=1885028 RepID=UPI00095E64B8|nr:MULTISPECIES: methyltransferase, FxLD system [unclassified Pseudonocardia]OLL75602.1 Protein-L-isoaspartate O-methyltransferase [Pseudonocardia sp. Ae150A_Ps1]OLL84287.1 Protein-L-isoaspartate O-methyltransferase [Pseudonocardia sp. Ae263_Ps1]